MKRLCIFVTHKFPFQTDETFIENEIGYLSQVFDTVLIIAAYANRTDIQTRSVPSNVMVTCLGYESISVLKKIQLGVKGFFHSNQETLQEVVKVSALGWKLNCFYFSGVVESMAIDAKRSLSEHVRLDEYESCLIYSYWFSEHALLSSALKQYCNQIVSTKVISRAHRYDVYAYRKKYKAFPFKEKMIREIDAVFPCSDDGSTYLASCYPQYANKIETAYLGTSDYGENPYENKGTFTIVSCSNIVPVKRVHLIAAALAEVKRLGIEEFQWICIGDGPLLENLKQKVLDDYNLGSHVQFLGRIPNQAVIQLYTNQYVDLFINVSANEGLPVSIMEAQSFGIPCIATDVGGTSEIIINNDVGMLLPETIQIKELCSHLIRFIEGRESWLPALRVNARANWLEKFNAETNYKKWISTLLQLVEV